jgi:hypothetical protein
MQAPLAHALLAPSLTLTPVGRCCAQDSIVLERMRAAALAAAHPNAAAVIASEVLGLARGEHPAAPSSSVGTATSAL